jgi:hypothetical protein
LTLADRGERYLRSIPERDGRVVTNSARAA